MKLSMECFVLPNMNPGPAITKRSSKGNKNRSKSRSFKLLQPESPTTNNSLDISVEMSNLLAKKEIYIEKRLEDHDFLKALAQGLGAKVHDNYSRSVTVYVGHKPPKSLTMNATPCVSPTWLTSCYKEKKFLPPIGFPIGIEKDHTRQNYLPVHQNQETDNPFGMEDVDYDYLEAHKPGQQLNMNEFVTRSARTYTTQETTQDMPSQFSTQPLHQTLPEQASQMELATQEEEEGHKEFYYNYSNSNSNSSKRKVDETPEEIEARLERKKAIQAKLRKARSTSSTPTPTRISTRSLSQKSAVSTGVYGQDRFSVWYGEQEFKHV